MSDVLERAFVASNIGETLANYSLVDEPLNSRGEAVSPSNSEDCTFEKDEYIWDRLLNGNGSPTQLSHPRSVWLYFVAVTEWIARVPGLYWLPGSDVMRRVSPTLVESETEGWRTYSPKGKSQKVSGGVGTLRLPPADDGYRLVTLTASLNASTGVPALVSPEVWEHHHFAEGSVIANGSAHWRDMPQRWAAQFPVLSGLPRGCLILNSPDQIVMDAREQAPVLVQPFSVMQYLDSDAELHDFVYATADTRYPEYRNDIKAFFDQYRKAQGREGEYLIASDIAYPMWDAVFASPEEMRANKGAQLRLIEQRVDDVTRGQDVVEALIRKLSSVPDLTTLKRLSARSGIVWQRWFSGGAISEEAARLVDAAIRAGKQLALVHAVQFEFAQ